MQQLESVKLVQFFLYERTELNLDAITGIFGRNGGGKSSLLDAIQIAMLGANTNLQSLNAQADEQNRLSRTMRAYCLGQYSPEQRVRDEATTYITLVWRNTETNEQLSMGVCLSASANSDTHVVLGRYVIRGVALAMDDHLETVDGTVRPRNWNGFRHQLQERSRITGEAPCFDDSRRYVMAALMALRGSAGAPHYDSFVRAFRFALRMRFEKGVDFIVRNDVLEDRPTNVRKFRDLVDTFSKLKNIVTIVEKKVDAGSKVAEAYSAILTETRKEATLLGLGASAQHTLRAEEHDQLTAKHEQASQLLENCQLQAEAAARLVLDLEQAKEHQQALQVAHAAHQDNAQVQASRMEAETRVRARRGVAVQSLNDLHRLLSSGASNPLLQDFHGSLKSQAEDISVLINDLDSLSIQDAIETVRRISKTASSYAFHLAEQQRVIAVKLSELDARMQDLSSSLDRAKAGRPPLVHAQRLLTELNNNGLAPTPVCDLVRITDPDWQPAIEAYLGRNVEALLANKDEEERAFQISRELAGARAVYGVKVAMTSRQNLGFRPATGSVAELIVGDNPAAVAFLRSLFGDIRRASETGDALAGGRTLTKDGMLVGRGEFERLKLVPAHELKIGAGGSGQVDNLTSRLKELTSERTNLAAEKGKVDALYSSMSQVASESTVLYIDGSITNLREALNDHEAASARAAKVSDAGYLAICQKIAELTTQIGDARPKHAAATAEVIRAEEAVKRASSDKDAAAIALKTVSERVGSLRANPDYDKLFASEQWDKLLPQFEKDFNKIATYCQEHAGVCARRIVQLTSKASSMFGTYLAEYRESPGQEVCDDWRKALAWMETEVARLRDTDLLEHREQASEAYRAAQETFRTDVAIALSNNLDALQANFDRLNDALRNCPSFSNGERYQFVRNVRPDLGPLLKFVQDVAANGAVRDLLDDAGEIPPEFAQLLDEKVAPGSSGSRSVLDDYREFFQFDVRIHREDPISKELNPVGMLSKRLGAGSGGEHRAPLYVIAGAALASAYRLDKTNRDGLRLILLDEAFDKMDMTNIIATMQYLEQLGLQIVMASPGENQGTLNAFMHSYYELQRDPDNNVVYIEKHAVSEAVRHMYREDLPEFNPGLLDLELAAMRSAPSVAATAAT